MAKTKINYIIFGALGGLVIGFLIWQPLAYFTTPLGAFIGWKFT